MLQLAVPLGSEAVTGTADKLDMARSMKYWDLDAIEKKQHTAQKPRPVGKPRDRSSSPDEKADETKKQTASKNPTGNRGNDGNRWNSSFKRRRK
jgi:hypothetical protein